jgi:ribosomal protein S12 methylthiotransferase
MQVERDISAEKMEGKIGRVVDVIIDESGDGPTIGRTIWDAPEIDGQVRLKTRRKLAVGDIVRCEIVEAGDYDLVAKVV